MIVYRGASRITLTLDTDSPLGAGGEARVLPVLGSDSLVAKIYHDINRVDEAKLRAMIGNPPSYPESSIGHTMIAWPLDLLTDSQDRILGFLMPRVSQMRPLIDFYNPSRRRRNYPLFSYRYLHRMALNMATAFKVLHDRGYVIGDVNQVNILGNEQTLVTLVDADSFQVREAAGHTFRCTVGTPEFTPPELTGKSFGQFDRAPEHDCFGLAVLIFRLLIGVHPFDGRFMGAGDPPPLEQRIASGHFPYWRDSGAPFSPPPTALPFEIMDPALRHLMEQCFGFGHKDPTRRPSAAIWRSALADAEDRLLACSVTPLHLYGQHLNSCPWCERMQLLGGRDVFGSPGLVSPNPLTSAQPDALPLSVPKIKVTGRPGFVATVLKRLRRSKPFGTASLMFGVAGCFAGSWILWPAIVALVLGLLGIHEARRLKKALAAPMIGTILGLALIVLGTMRTIDESDRQQEAGLADASEKERIQMAAAREREMLGRQAETQVSAQPSRVPAIDAPAEPFGTGAHEGLVSKPSSDPDSLEDADREIRVEAAPLTRRFERFFSDLTYDDGSNVTQHRGSMIGTTLSDGELVKLHHKIMKLGGVASVEITKHTWISGECYLEGIAFGAGAALYFQAHVSDGESPNQVVNVEITEEVQAAPDAHLPGEITPLNWADEHYRVGIK